MRKNYLKSTALAFSLTILTACGGGGGGDSTISSSISGTASKGIIINGIVKAYKIENGLISTTEIAEGTTDATGAYSLTITGYDGPVHIEVSAGASSTMKCDAASGCGSYAFGDEMPMPATLKMAAVIPSVSAGSVSGHITPLTNMAATFAQSNYLDASNIATAIAKVEEIFDIPNLMSTKPIDITDSTAVAAAETSGDGGSLKVGFISAAIAELAETDGGGDIESTINTLADNFAANNGEFVNNTTSDDSGDEADASTITLGEITTLTLAAVTKYESDSGDDLTDTLVETTVQAVQTAATTAEPDSTTVTIVPVSDTALADAIAAGKDTVTTLRTWATQLTKLDDASLLFDTEITMAETASTLAMDTVGTGLRHGSYAAAEAYWASTQATGLNAAVAGKTITYTDNIDDTTGQITFDCDGNYDDGGDIGEYSAIGNSLYLDALSPGTMDFNLTFPSTMPAIGNTVTYTVATSEPGVYETGTSDIDNIEISLSCDLTPSTNLADYVGGVDAPGVSATGSVIVTDNNVTINGVITDDGSVSLTPGNSTVAMNYSFPALSGSNFTVAIDGTVTNTDKATLTIADTSSANMVFTSSIVLGDEVTTTPAVDSASFDMDATLAQGSLADDGSLVTDPISFNGTLSVNGIRTSGTTADTTEGNPNQITLTGTFSAASGKSYVASFSANMANASSFVAIDALGTTSPNLASYAFSSSHEILTITYPRESVVYTYNTSLGRIEVKAYDDDGELTLDLSWPAQCLDSGVYAICTGLVAFLEQYSSEMWGQTWVPGEGEYYVAFPSSLALTGGTLSGVLIEQESDGETASNWRRLSADLSFAANDLTWVDPLGIAPNETLPDATITIGFDRTAYMTASVNVLISYDDIAISISGSANGLTETASATIVVTDTSVVDTPVSLTITPNFESATAQGSLSVGGKVIGSIREDVSLGAIINYVDGSFESVTF